MKQPTYPLNELLKLVRGNTAVVTRSAKQGAYALRLDNDDVIQIVSELDARSFYKSMPAEKMPGFFQDVYRVNTRGLRLYIKLQVRNERVVIVSFKEDESAK